MNHQRNISLGCKCPKYLVIRRGGINDGAQPVIKKTICFLSSGWPKVWPVGRPHSFSHSFLVWKKMSIFGKKMRKKMSPVAPFFLVTQPLNRKHNYFYGSLKVPLSGNSLSVSEGQTF